MLGLNAYRDECFQTTEEKGFHAKPNQPGELIALAHSELSEALEEVRDGHGLNEVYYKIDKNGLNKPEGVPVELADVIIRIFDMCGLWGIDIEKVVREKMDYNKTRPYQHGGRILQR